MKSVWSFFASVLVAADVFAAKDTASVQARIDACSAAGGGRVAIEKGTYEIGTVYLKDNVELHLEKGAVLVGSANLDDYCGLDAYPQNWESKAEGWGAQHLIVAAERKNVAITGEGTIDGNGRAFFEDEPAWHGSVSWRDGYIVARYRRRPGQTVVFVECEGVRVEGVTLRDMTCWSCFFYGCDRVRVRGVTIRNDIRHANTDGFDIDSCREVEVSDCDIETGDDAFAVRGAPARLKNKDRVCEDVYIHDCTARTSASGTRIGVGNGKIRNVRFENVVFNRSGNAINLQCNYGRGEGGVDISGVSFKNVKVRDAVYGICATGGNGYPTAVLKDVVFEGVEVEASVRPIQVVGRGRTRPANIAFREVKFSPPEKRTRPYCDEQLPAILVCGADGVTLDGKPLEENPVMFTRGLCAHQGGIDDPHPGNTVEAIVSAVAKGATMVEFDVRRCKTGEYVLMHDPDVRRTTDGKGKVSDLTLEELKALKVKGKTGRAYRIPTLEEIFTSVPAFGVWMDVHLYCGDENVPDLARKFRDRGVLYQTIFCGHPKLIAKAREAVPGLIGNNCYRTGPRNRDWTDEECRKFIAKTKAAKCEFLQLNRPWARKYSDLAHAEGIRVIHFKSDDRDEKRRLIEDAGIDFVMTNKVE